MKESPRRANFWDALAKYRKQSAILIAASVVVLLVLTYLLPQNYEAVATSLPPEQSGAGGMISALLSNSLAANFLKSSDNPTLELFKTIVESRNVAQEVAKDPKIRKFCAIKDTSEEGIVNRLQAAVTGEADRTGSFTVTVDLKTGYSPGSEEAEQTRLMSAYIANRFVEELDRFNRERLMTSAHSTRVFIEKEYEDRMAQLDTTYHRLQAFQEKNQAISLPEQLGATVTAAAQLVGQIQKLETQLAVEQRDLSPNSDRVQLIQSQIAAARAQLARYDDGGAGEYVLALKSVPQLTREFAGYMREAKVLEQVTAYLRQQVEQERISEQRDLPSLQVLDPAKAPQGRTSPKRSLMAVIGLVLGVFFSWVYVRFQMISTGIRTNPEQHYRIVRFLDVVRGRERVAAGPGATARVAEAPVRQT